MKSLPVRPAGSSRIVLTVLATALATGLALLAPGGASARASAPVVTASGVSAAATLPYAERVRVATNRHRNARGIRGLARSACAERYAAAWARTLASRDGDLAHQDLGRVLRGCSAGRVGENVAYLFTTDANEVVRMWMNSSGHRANILNARYTHLGVGAVRSSSGRLYVVQVFTG